MCSIGGILPVCTTFRKASDKIFNYISFPNMVTYSDQLYTRCPIGGILLVCTVLKKASDKKKIII